MTYAKLIQNLDEPYPDATGTMRSLLTPGRYLFTYGVFYPDSPKFEAKQIVFVSRTEKDYLFEKPNWWIDRVASLGNFYLKSQFGDGEIDYRNYRTNLALSGERSPKERLVRCSRKISRSGRSTSSLRLARPQSLVATGTSNLRRWEESRCRSQWLTKIEGLTVGSPTIEVLTGLETWFTMSPRQPIIPPPRYKMATLTWIAIFPLVNIIPLLTS